MFDNDWDPLPVILNGDSEMSAEATWTIPAADSRAFVLTHPGPELLGGWIRVASSDTSLLKVVAVVRFYNGDALILESGVSAELPLKDHGGLRTIHHCGEVPLPSAPSIFDNRLSDRSLSYLCSEHRG